MIKINNLHRKYGDIHAVKGIDLEVEEGEIFGIIGPDGAGKTSIFNMLAGVLKPSEGEIIMPEKETGYLTQQFSFYTDLTVDENLEYSAGLRNIPKNIFNERKDKYLKLMGLEKFTTRLGGELSGGMKQKLALCCVLVFQPKILLLDEPTTGVDPISRREFWDVLAALSSENVTIIVATPYFDEAQRCHRIALIHDGEITEVGTPQEVMREQSPAVIQRKTSFTCYKVAIETNSLNKFFGNFHAVENLNLKVCYGEIYGLLGANGAGKTTTIKMICGLLNQTSGEISLAGETQNLRSSALRQKIGYMSQKFTLYNDLTILENLKFYCGVYNVPKKQQAEKIKWVLSSSGLSGQENMLTGALPGGWKQRISFGASVMHEPEILFLDEPTSGVDPAARKQLWELVQDISCKGTAVIVTTHYLEEAENCDRIAFMSGGKIIAEDSPQNIKASQQGVLLEISADFPQKANSILKNVFESWKVSLFGRKLHVVIENPDTEISKIYSSLEESGIKVFSSEEIPFSLEDCFINIIQRGG